MSIVWIFSVILFFPLVLVGFCFVFLDVVLFCLFQSFYWFLKNFIQCILTVFSPLPHLFSDPPAFPYISIWCPLYFFKPIKYTLGSPNNLGCGLILWSRINLPWVVPLKKNELSLFWQVSVANSFLVWLSLSMLGFCLTWTCPQMCCLVTLSNCATIVPVDISCRLINLYFWASLIF